MADMIYRRLEDDGSYVFGRGKNGFLSGREAVGQAIKTRLLLFQGEWWENVTEGLPFFQNIAGTRNNEEGNIRTVGLLVQNIIAGTRDVTDINEEELRFDTDTRTLHCKYTVDTVYGQVIVDANAGTGSIIVEVN